MGIRKLLKKSVEEDVVSEKGKRKATENEHRQEKRRRLDSIRSDNEVPSTSGDTEGRNTPEAAPSAKKKAVTNDGPVQTKKRKSNPKRKATEDEHRQEKRRQLDSIPCDNEVPSTSGDTESINTPEAAPSAKKKAVTNDGPVQTKKRKLNPTAMFKAKYKQQKKLCNGSYGCVFAGYRKVDNLAVAIKHIPADQEILIHQDDNGELVPMEVAVMKKLGAASEQHSAHVELFDWYDLGEELVLVMERPETAVDLHQYIIAKGGHLDEKEAKIITRQLVDAAIDLQQKQIFHRDIKVNNLLIETGLDTPRLRVIDFGVSCFFKEGDQYNEFHGFHAPPEWDSQLEYQAGPTTVYQIGVALFDMLQNPTFKAGIFYQRQRIKWWFSENCRDFLKSCFHTDPEDRLTLEQLRNHLWIR